MAPTRLAKASQTALLTWRSPSVGAPGMPAGPSEEPPEHTPALSVEQARSELASCVLNSSYKYCLGAPLTADSSQRWVRVA